MLGSDYTDVSTGTELSFNARVAANLGSAVVLVVHGRDRTPDQIRVAADGAIAELRANHAQTVAVVANRVEPADLDAVRAVLAALPFPVTAAMPENPLLSAPSFRALADAIGRAARARQRVVDGPRQPRPHRGGDEPAQRPRAARPRRHRHRARATGPTSSPACMLAHQSGTFPTLAGIILTGGYPIPETIARLSAGVQQDLPIALTDDGTFRTAERLMQVRGPMTKTSRNKIETARRLFSESVDQAALLRAIDVSASEVRTPLMFEFQLMERARSDRKHIVLPESQDDRILEAADILLRRGRRRPDPARRRDEGAGPRLGPRARPRRRGRRRPPPTPTLVERFAQEYAVARAHKGMTVERAREVVTDISYFGTMMVHLGLADGMVSGAVNTTAHTIRPALEFVKTAQGVKTVSSVFLMCLADRVLVYGDCAVIPDPTAEQLADIAISSAQTAEQFGIEPRVAMLSYSTGSSGSGAEVEKVRAATELVRRAGTGPARSPGRSSTTRPSTRPSAAAKMPDSEVAGHATVFVFPDLNTGNNTYKAVQRSAHAVAVGPGAPGPAQAGQRPLPRRARRRHRQHRRDHRRPGAGHLEAAGRAPVSGSTNDRPVLVLNAGSSSLKYQLLLPETGEVQARGLVERIGESGSDVADHAAALRSMAERLRHDGIVLDEVPLRAVGHRVVHGGPDFSEPVVIDDAVLDRIRELSALAPLHNPAAVTGIEAARERFDVPHVAVFDTAFFSSLPAEASTYAVPRDLAAKHSIRRYGFHGTSHQYVSTGHGRAAGPSAR